LGHAALAQVTAMVTWTNLFVSICIGALELANFDFPQLTLKDRQHRPSQQTLNMASRPTVSVHSTSGGNIFIFYVSISQFTCYSEASSSLPLPAVLTAPIRLDVVQQVHSACRHCICVVVRLTSSQRALPRTSVRLMPSARKRAIRPLPSLGVLVVPSLVFPASAVAVLTAQVKLRSVTCAVVVGCSRPRRPGVGGTSK
jgi:hypothetical protein